MKINRKIILSISLSIVIIISTIVVLVVVVQPRLRLKEYDNIIIWNNRDFNLYNFPGKGTKDKPYLIQNLNITTSFREGIYISDTTKYFIIQNCIIKAEYVGIYIENVASGTVSIINTTCNYGREGIYIINSPRSYLEKNNCNQNSAKNGITLVNSPNSRLIENNCNDNYGRDAYVYEFSDGIYIQNSPNTTLNENTCNNNQGYGISIFLSSNTTIVSNRIEDNILAGISIEKSKSSVIKNNKLSNNALMIERMFYYIDSLIEALKERNIEYYLSFVIEDNLVNGKPLEFYKNKENEVFRAPQAGQLIFVNCTSLTVKNINL